MRKVPPIALLIANLGVILFFWAGNSGSLLGVGGAAALLAIARLAGLLAGYALITQIVLIGRAPWVEQAFGLDRLSRAHHWNGFALIALTLIHPLLTNAAHAALNGMNIFERPSFSFARIPQCSSPRSGLSSLS